MGRPTESPGSQGQTFPKSCICPERYSHYPLNFAFRWFVMSHIKDAAGGNCNKGQGVTGDERCGTGRRML